MGFGRLSISIVRPCGNLEAMAHCFLCVQRFFFSTKSVFPSEDLGERKACPCRCCAASSSPFICCCAALSSLSLSDLGGGMATASPDSSTKDSSYTYWVRRKTEQAAPDPVPRKLSAQDLAEAPQPALRLGSAWNQAGTWEEKSLTKWSTNRIEELLLSLEPLELKDGRAQVTEVCSCVGEATLVTVRNKKWYGYTYEITMKFKGDWREVKDVEGTLKVPEASYNDLDDLQLEVNLSSVVAMEGSEKSSFLQALKSFLPAVKEQLRKFEDELKAR